MVTGTRPGRYESKRTKTNLTKRPEHVARAVRFWVAPKPLMSQANLANERVNAMASATSSKGQYGLRWEDSVQAGGFPRRWVVRERFFRTDVARNAYANLIAMNPARVRALKFIDPSN